MKLTIKALTALLVLAYPFAVLYFSDKGLQPRWLALVLLIILATKMLSGKNVVLAKTYIVWIILIGCLLIFNNSLFAKLYPIIISLSLLSMFTLSLKYPPSIAERFARLQEPDLPEQGVRYCRRVTKVWCAFFIFNACVSALTLLAPLKLWTLYNGFISYILMAAIFAVEYILRLTRK